MAKRAKRRDCDLEFLNTALNLNARTYEEGPKKKTWTGHDLKTIKPLTPTQNEAFQVWFGNKNQHIALLGSAGCGKSYIGIYLAMCDILDNRNNYKSLKIVRSIVQTRQIGALPGTLEEKKQPIFQIYESIFADLFGKQASLTNMVERGLVELIDTSYIRGDTWNDSVILVDEVNNMNPHEVHTVMTRVGTNSRVILAGDEKQSDLVSSSNKNDKHDFKNLLNTLRNMKAVSIIEFSFDDIVRSQFVKDWIIASGNY